MSKGVGMGDVVDVDNAQNDGDSADVVDVDNAQNDGDSADVHDVCRQRRWMMMLSFRRKYVPRWGMVEQKP